MKILLGKIQSLPLDFKIVSLLLITLISLLVADKFRERIKKYTNLKKYRPGTGSLWLCPYDLSSPKSVAETFLNYNIPHKFFRVLKRIEIREPFKRTTGSTQVEYWD